MFNDGKPKCKEPKTIIDVINGNDSICKMIHLYIYKILFNNNKIDVFINEKSINKYQLKEYKDFNELIISNNELLNIYKLDYKIKTLKDNYYDESYQEMEKYKKEEFNKTINTKDFNIEEFGIVNFYIVSYNLVFSYLGMGKLDINTNFYNNIYEPLFKNEQLLHKAIQLFNTMKLKKVLKLIRIILMYYYLDIGFV